MYMKKIFSTLFISSILSTMSFAAGNYGYTGYQPNYGYDVNYGYENSNLQGHAVYVPAGVTCQGVLSQQISSESAIVGQSVSVVLKNDFVYNNQIIAPVGSTIYGSIVSNQKAGLGNRNAKTMVRFTTISTPYGNTIPINAIIATTDLTGVLKGGAMMDSAKEYAKDTVVGAGTGAVLGTAMGALAGGSVGKGAVYGTALGAGVGLLKRTADKGEPVLIPANSVVNLYFIQPITFTAQ